MASEPALPGTASEPTALLPGLFSLQQELLSKIFVGQYRKGSLVCKRLLKELRSQRIVLNLGFLLRRRVVCIPFTILNDMLVPDLREICSEHGITAHRYKSALIDEIMEFSNKKTEEALAGIADNREEWHKKIDSFVGSSTQIMTRLSLRLYDSRVTGAEQENHHTRQNDDMIHRFIQEFHQIPNLTELEFHLSSYCNRQFLAAVVGGIAVEKQISSLVSLKIGGMNERNEWGCIAAERLASCFENCRLLNHFEMSFCHLDTPAAAALFANLPNARQLTALSLSYISLNDAGIEHLAAGLQNASALRLLCVQDLQDSSMVFGSERGQLADASKITRSLRHIPSLTALELGGILLDDVGAAMLAESLRALSRLARLHVMLCSRSRGPILAALQHTPLLTALDVGDAALFPSHFEERFAPRPWRRDFGDAGATELAAALRSTPRLTFLGLARTGLTAQGLEALSSALSETPGLTGLGLMGNLACDGMAQLLGAAPCLSLLDLRCAFAHNQLDMTALCAGLRCCTALESLDLSESHAEWGQPQVVGALMEALAAAPRLSRLCLNSLDLGPSGANALELLLRGASALTALQLEANSLGPEGAQALAPGLRFATALKELKLRSNDLGDPGALALAVALAGLTNLTAIDLSFNNLRAGGATRVAESLRGVDGLALLDLTGNRVQGPARNRVARILATAEPPAIVR